jgi:hypothetical protein
MILMLCSDYDVMILMLCSDYNVMIMMLCSDYDVMILMLCSDYDVMISRTCADIINLWKSPGRLPPFLVRVHILELKSNLVGEGRWSE